MIQIIPPKNTNYWINQRALSFSENDLNDPNRVAVSLVSGSVIMAYVQDIIDYATDGSYEKWTLRGYSTLLVNPEAHYIYARLSRTDRTALVVFSVKNYNIDGSITTVNETDGTSTTTDPSVDYFYIKIGELTATDGTSYRELTYDSGLLSTKKGDSETGVNEMWELSKMSTPWLIMAKQWLYSFVVKGFITLIGGLIFKKNDTEKTITDIKRSQDSDQAVPIGDDNLTTSQYVESRVEQLDERFLRKDKNDLTAYSLSVGGDIDVEGKIITNTSMEVGKFVSGSSGASIYKDAETGQTVGEMDKLYIRMKAYFETLEIINVNTIGGKQILSPGGSVKCLKVEELDSVYRCYFLAEQDGEKIQNRYKVNDQIYSQMFDAVEGVSHNVSSHFFWRLCTNVSKDSVDIEDKKYHYIDLSKTDCDEDSDIPAVGDILNQRGNRTDIDRMNFIEQSSVDAYSPNITLFHGVNSYSLAGKEYVSFGVDKTSNKAFMNIYGEMYVGDRNQSSYIRYTQDAGLEVCGKLAVGTKLGDSDLQDLIASATPEGYQEFVEKVTQDISGLQQQIDGAIESFFYQYAPTNENYPASGWTDEESKKAHLNDTFTNLIDGRSWRWTVNAGVYGWTEITDTATTQALALAGKAQDTADGKRRVFTSVPTVPYDKGDLWSQGKDSPLMICITAKSSNQVYNASDWDYADNTEKVREEMNNLVNDATNNLNEAIEQAKEEAVNSSNNYTDEGKKLLQESIDAMEKAKANITEVYKLADGDSSISDVEKRALAAAQEEAGAAVKYYDEIVKAYADGTITEEELASISGAKASLDAAKKYAQEQAQAVQDNVDNLEYGKINLIRNSGFTGDYVTSALGENVVLNEDSEMFSPSLTHWDYSNAYTQESEVSESGKEVIISADGYIKQTLFYKLISNENYVFSCRASGSGSITLSVGGYSKSFTLSSDWNLYADKFVTLNDVSVLRIDATAECYLCELQLERGTIRSAWGMSPLDNQTTLAQYESLTYLSQAIKDGSSEFVGGLGLTNLMFAKDIDGNITTGISGIYNNDNSVAYFSGGDYEKAIYTSNVYKDNPSYEPSEEELSKIAKCVITHGGRAILNEVILRGYIHALGGVFKNIQSPNGDFRVDEDGVTHIGAFCISNSGLTNKYIDPNGSIKYNDLAYVLFKTENGDATASIGTSVSAPSTGISFLAKFENHEQKASQYSALPNYALYLSSQGALDNCALQIDGGYIEGFAYKNTIVNNGTSYLDRTAMNVLCINTSAATIYLPQMKVHDDGHPVRIKIMGTGSVNVKRSSCETFDGFKVRDTYPVIVYGRSSLITSNTTGLNLGIAGDASEFVWVRDIKHTVDGVDYYGAWVQYRMPGV